MSPIRVGLIGLSGATDYEGTAWAANAHLPFLQRSEHFTLAALLNSSVQSAQAAIEKYNLPKDTKAYGNPQDLANDPDIDLVVCSVRVDRHFLTVRPSLEAGKAVFVEWPLDRNLEVAKEMASLAAAHNAETIVGLQASYSPIIRKLRQLVHEGAIGRILSSTLLGSCGNELTSESKNVRYFLDRTVGGNLMSIAVGHNLESVISVLGEFKSFTSSCAISRPELDIVNYADGGKVIEKSVRNTVPDQILVHGTAEESNAFVTINLYAGKEMPGLPRLDWRIQGEKGWLRVTSPMAFLNVGTPETKLQLYRTESGQVEEVTVDEDEWDSLPIPGQNIARLYEAYRKGEWYPTFDWAVRRHELIDGMWKRFDKGIQLGV
ncbi:galactose/lactose metabolism regulatory protein GAL80 [Aspergillus udagawae]|nr:galactose/lactose metabolism regulatory protein GAL80 [Aspergillus udagawae]